ncbi:MAG: hypothetical protein GY722_17755 [bacterium]|nr:hypothetical protein [bacterium]
MINGFDQSILEPLVNPLCVVMSGDFRAVFRSEAFLSENYADHQPVPVNA